MKFHRLATMIRYRILAQHTLNLHQGKVPGNTHRADNDNFFPTFCLDKLATTDIRIVHTTAAIMSDSPVTLRTRKFIRNPLLGRKQMVV